jgi:hypothetical protein
VGRDGTLEEPFEPERDCAFRHRSPEHFVEIFRTSYAPMSKAFAALRGNRSGDSALVRDSAGVTPPQ